MVFYNFCYYFWDQLGCCAKRSTSNNFLFFTSFHCPQLFYCPPPCPTTVPASLCVNIKNRNHNGGNDDFLLNCNIGCTKHTADLALIASRFSQALSQETFTSKWWFWSKVEAWNFTKNKLLKPVNSIWTQFFRKKRQKNAPFIDDALKTRGIKYSHVEIWLLFAPLSKFLATCLPLHGTEYKLSAL